MSKQNTRGPWALTLCLRTNLAMGQGSKSCTYALFLPQGVEIELIFALRAAVYEIRANFSVRRSFLATVLPLEFCWPLQGAVSLLFCYCTPQFPSDVFAAGVLLHQGAVSLLSVSVRRSFLAMFYRGRSVGLYHCLQGAVILFFC